MVAAKGLASSMVTAPEDVLPVLVSRKVTLAAGAQPPPTAPVKVAAVEAHPGLARDFEHQAPGADRFVAKRVGLYTFRTDQGISRGKYVWVTAPRSASATRIIFRPDQDPQTALYGSDY